MKMMLDEWKLQYDKMTGEVEEDEEGEGEEAEETEHVMFRMAAAHPAMLQLLYSRGFRWPV